MAAERGAPTRGTEQLAVKQLIALAEAFRAGVDVKDRYHRLKSYKSCFVGSEAVSWLIEHKHADTREEAVALGLQLFDAGIFYHVKGEQRFVDDYIFYQFQEHDVRGDEDGGGEPASVQGHIHTIASKCGYLLKQGKGKLSRFNRRWFVLSGAYLFYYKLQYDAHPAGDIPLADAVVTKSSDSLGFAIVCANRTFQICAENETDLWDWIGIIRKVIAKTKRFDTTPATPLQRTLRLYTRGLMDSSLVPDVTAALARVNGVTSIQVDPTTELLSASVVRDVDVEQCLTALEAVGIVPILA